MGKAGSCLIEEMVSHVRHMYQKGGEEVIAIGTDFDGFGGAEKMESKTSVRCPFFTMRSERPDLPGGSGRRSGTATQNV